MSKFIKSPFWDNWFVQGDVDRSLIICSPYFKKNALDKIIDQFDLDDDECILNIKILIRGQLDDFLKGSSDLTALDALLALPCVNVDNVRRVTNLHMKAYLRDDNDLLIGSGNCTAPGLSFGNRLGNVEGGIQTDDDEIISDFNEYFNEIFEASESLNDFYDSITEQYTEEARAPFREPPTVNRDRAAEINARFDFREPVNNVDILDAALEMTVQDIPQFSNFDIVLNETLLYIKESSDNGHLLSFSELGQMLPGQNADNDTARKKYGENHAKTAELLGFVTIVPNRLRLLQITPLGETYLSATEDEKNRILTRQLTRSTIVRDIFGIYAVHGPFDITEYLERFMSHSTAVRRRPNVKAFFQKLVDLNVEGAEDIMNNVFNY